MFNTYGFQSFSSSAVTKQPVNAPQMVFQWMQREPDEDQKLHISSQGDSRKGK